MGMQIYHPTVQKAMEGLSDERAGKLFHAMLQYGLKGTEPDFGEDTDLKSRWKSIRDEIGEIAEPGRQGPSNA